MSQNNSTVTTETCDSSMDAVHPSNSNGDNAEEGSTEKPDDFTPSSSGIELKNDIEQSSSDNAISPERPPVFKTPESKIKPVIYKGSPDLDKLDKQTVPVPMQNFSISPTSNSVRIMARVASVMTSPTKNNLEMDTVRTGFTTPTKVRKISPKSPKEGDENIVPSYKLPKVEKSPRRHNLRQRARHIAPKTVINRSLYISPTKKAADSIKARAINNQKWKQNLMHNPLKEVERVQSDQEEEGEDISEENVQNDDQEHLNQLMEASSTIRFQPKNKSKKKTKREVVEDLLGEDIISIDNLRDERDTAFACKYLKDVQQTLKNDMDRYEKFLEIFEKFDQENECPSKLYKEIKELVPDHPNLVEDFANFLLPEQAIEAGCYMVHHQITKARKFLRKLEILFGSNSAPFQKIIRIIKSAESVPENVLEIIEHLKAILKQHPHLLEELSLFFNDEKPPQSMTTNDDFEEIDLLDSDKDEEMAQDEYENIVLPDDPSEDYGTKQCSCKCHENTEDLRLQKRKKHCIGCGITIINGRMYLLTQGTHLRPADIHYHGRKPKWMIKRDAAKKAENANEEANDKTSDNEKTVKRKKRVLRKLVTASKDAEGSTAADADAEPSEAIQIPSSTDSESDDVGENDSSEEHSDVGGNLPDILEHSSNDADGATAGDDSDSDPHLSEPEVDPNSRKWVKEEDEILLGTFKAVEATDDIFYSITEKLEGRTVDEVEKRFYYLISLMKPQEGESDDDQTHDNGDEDENSCSEMEADTED